MSYRDRVKELRRVRAGELKPHPKNWRTHSRFQQDTLRGVLREVGMADALLVRELPDGSLQLVDGHLRASTSPSTVVPVLVLDLNEAETEKVLLTHDPLGALAGVDEQRLSELLSNAQSEHKLVNELFDKLARQVGEAGRQVAETPEIDLQPSYQILVEVADESEQRELYERLRSEGRECRVLTL